MSPQLNKENKNTLMNEGSTETEGTGPVDVLKNGKLNLDEKFDTLYNLNQSEENTQGTNESLAQSIKKKLKSQAILPPTIIDGYNVVGTSNIKYDDGRFSKIMQRKMHDDTRNSHQIKAINRKKYVLKQERSHSIYVKNQQFRVLQPNNSNSRLENKQPHSIRLSVNVDQIVAGRNEMLGKGPQAMVTIDGQKIDQKDRYASIFLSAKTPVNHDTTLAATPINNQASASYPTSSKRGPIDDESKFKLQPSIDIASSKDDNGSQTVYTENYDEDVIRDSKQITTPVPNPILIEFDPTNNINA